MSIMYGEIIFHHTTGFFFLRLKNVIISNYNKCSKLTLTQKIKEWRACSETSIILLLCWSKRVNILVPRGCSKSSFSLVSQTQKKKKKCSFSLPLRKLQCKYFKLKFKTQASVIFVVAHISTFPDPQVLSLSFSLSLKFVWNINNTWFILVFPTHQLVLQDNWK